MLVSALVGAYPSASSAPWVAVTVQRPAVPVNVTTPLLASTLQTLGVDEEKVITPVSPIEPVATSVTESVVKALVGGEEKVTTSSGALGVTLFDGPEKSPVAQLLMAATLKV